jgi:hypothetical protein|tara:strand:- start:10447 stop:10650 length:204 start_codon:yes stop_codon:yes gene_type:complete
MKIGDLIQWWWYLQTDSWEKTDMQGLIVNSHVMSPNYDGVRIFDVLLTDGTLCEVREDEEGMEMIND